MKVHVCVIINCMCIDQITLQGLLYLYQGSKLFLWNKKNIHYPLYIYMLMYSHGKEFQNALKIDIRET